MPPKTLFVPAKNSDGSCYHITKCGAHTLRELPFEEAVEIIKRDRLVPCGNCQKHHGLTVHFDHE